VLAIFGAELRFPIKITNLRGDLYGSLGNVEGFNPTNAALGIL